MSEEIKVPSDEELGCMMQGLVNDVAFDWGVNAWTNAASTFRAAVDAPWRAKVERLKAEVKDWRNGSDAEAQGGDEARRECDDLRAKLAEAEAKIERQRKNLDAARRAREQRTVPVTFECTAEDLRREFHRSYTMGDPLGLMQKLMDYLSTRVRVVVPDEVPSSQEICTAIKFDGNLSHYHVNRILQYLAPYLARPVDVEPSPDTLATVLVNELMSSGITNVCFDAQPAKEKTALRCAAIAVWNHQRHARPVDPTLCETPLRRGEPNTPGKYQLVLSTDGDVFGMHFTEYGIGKSWWDSPEAAHEYGLWLLSFAAKHGEDVRLGPIAISGQPDAEVCQRLMP